MDNQTTYNEAMAKLAEAQKCQDEIVSYNNELYQVNEAIIEIYNTFNVYKTKQYLSSRQTTLNYQINNRNRERNEKLNEALSKALDLADDEIDNGKFALCSPSMQVITTIYNYARLHNISCQYSIEVDAKFAKIIAKGASALNQFLNQQRMFGY